MRKGLVLACLVAAAGACGGTAALARPHHRPAIRHVQRPVAFRIYPRFARRPHPPLAATVGVAIPPAAARFMGYPYNVRGYRYGYADGCLLRVGGIEGPGPSIAPCPFGADRASR